MAKVETIDAARLKTDLMYRFDYLCKFVEFGEEDIAAIKGSAGLLAPLVPTIVDAVYNKLFSFDITKAFFLPRNQGYEGDLAQDLEHLNLHHDQVCLLLL